MTLATTEPMALKRTRAFRNAFLRKMSGFAALSESDMAAMALVSARARPEQARSDMVDQGDSPGGALILLEGFACRYRHLGDGRRQILAFLLPGDLCDFDSALLGRMDHAIGTLTVCSVARVSSEVLANLMREHPRVGSAVRRAKLAEEAILRDWVVSLGRRSAAERMAHLLCEILDRLQMVGLAVMDGCDLPITQADLGDAAGLSTVHVNRSLQTLRAKGLIQLGAKRLRVIDLPSLRSLCEFTPSLAKSVLAPVTLGAA